MKNKDNFTFENLKKEIADEINNALGGEFVQSADLVYPPDIEMGDLSLPCFVVAKQTGMNPAEVAEKLVSVLAPLLKVNNPKVTSFFTAGPYLNIKLEKKNLLKTVIGDIRAWGSDYGLINMGEGQEVMIEFSNVNTHKEYHVGHLRNLCYGNAVKNLMNKNGFKAIPVSYVNDFGIHVAKTLWAYLEFFKNEEPAEGKGYFLGSVYVRSNKELEKHEHNKDLVKFMMKKIESRQGEEYELWRKTREWNIEQFSAIYKELDIKFEKTFYESEFIDEGREMIDDLIEKDILKYSQGAVIADLEAEDLGILVFLRSDGTATYPVADLPLAIKKFESYDLDASIYVVDGRQELYFKQLFRIMKKIGYKKPMIHLAYDVVKLPGGMMSSRSGNVISYEDLKRILDEKIKNETMERHPDWSQERVDVVVNSLVRATIKFEMLKVGAKQVITFDIEKALSFQGFTAAYLLYTCARINSIISKSGLSADDLLSWQEIVLNEEKEHSLIIRLAKYPDAVKLAGQNHDPSVIAKYVFELAQEFNDYYHAVPVLESENKNSRLVLLHSVESVITNALFLLGIETVKEM